MRRYGICLFINFFLCVAAKSQQQIPHATSATQPFLYVTSLNAFSQSKDSAKAFLPYRITPISSTFYANNVGFFCKKELQMEKVTGLPLKFRLGSVSYTDKMEGKGAGTIRPH